MGWHKLCSSIILFVIIVILSVFGGSWSLTYALDTVPTEPAHSGYSPPIPTKLPGDLAGKFSQVECMSAFLGPDTHLDQYFLLYPNTRSLLVWGGVYNASGTTCQDATETVCAVPVRYLPKREQLFFYSQGIEVRQFIAGKQDNTDLCGPKEVYFDLTRYERFIYDNHPDRFGFYYHNPNNGAWEICPRVRIDKNTGSYGRITCSTTQWGYFALGWPAKQ